MSVEEIELDLAAARQAFLALRGLWFVTQMLPRLDMQDRFGPNVANNVRSGLELTTDGAGCRRERTAAGYGTGSGSCSTTFDHLLTPCVAVPPFPVEQNYPDSIARQADEDLHRLDRADLRAEPHGAAGGVRAGGTGFERHAGRIADRWKAVWRGGCSGACLQWSSACGR